MRQVEKLKQQKAELEAHTGDPMQLAMKNRDMKVCEVCGAL